MLFDVYLMCLLMYIKAYLWCTSKCVYDVHQTKNLPWRNKNYSGLFYL